MHQLFQLNLSAFDLWKIHKCVYVNPNLHFIANQISKWLTRDDFIKESKVNIQSGSVYP